MRKLDKKNQRIFLPYLYRFLPSLVMMVTISACTQLDDFSGIETTNAGPEYALPLFNAKFSMRDVFEKFSASDVLVIDPDGLIRFKYKGDVLTKSSEDVFDAINNGLPEAIPLLENPLVLPFSFPGTLELDKLILKKGYFLYQFTNSESVALTGTLSLPEFMKDGQSLSVDLDLAPGVTITNEDFPVLLEGYNIIPNENGELVVIYDLQDADGTPYDVNPAFIKLDTLELAYAEGYLGQETYDEGRDTIYIDFFENWINGDIWFQEPKITIRFENSFGVPTRSIVDVFEVFTVREDVLPLESIFIEEGIDFPYPTLEEIGQVKFKEFVFSIDNSNIDDILGAGPLALDYDVNATTNPEEDATVRGFVTDSSYYKVQIEVDLPFYGRANHFEATDTFDIDLSTYETVSEAEFKLIADNELPLEIEGQIYFQDVNSVTIDSLFEIPTILITGAPIDMEGNVIGIESKTTFIPVLKEKFTNLQKAKKIILAASFSTSNGGSISAKVLADQEISIRMGLKIKK